MRSSCDNRASTVTPISEGALQSWPLLRPAFWRICEENTTTHLDHFLSRLPHDSSDRPNRTRRSRLLRRPSNPGGRSNHPANRQAGRRFPNSAQTVSRRSRYRTHAAERWSAKRGPSFLLLAACLIATTILGTSCRDQPDECAPAVSALQARVDALNRKLAVTERDLAVTERDLVNERKRAAAPDRTEIARLLGAATEICCHVSSVFDVELVTKGSAEGHKLIEAGLATLRNGEIWPPRDRDERWQPLGRYDAADGWPPADATSVAWWVRPADRRIEAVDGVSQPNPKQLLVDFTWRWSRNEIGNAWGKGPTWEDDTYHARAALLLFDDGWRVDSVSLGERKTP